MEQIKAHIAVSLDGHTATPDYELDWMPREVKELAAREHAAASCLLMGANTYNYIFEHWGGWPHKSKRSFVVSHYDTNVTPDCGVEFLTEEPLQRVYELKQETDMLVVGGGKLLTSLIKAGLLDSLTIYTVPVMAGKGIGFVGETSGSLWKFCCFQTDIYAVSKFHASEVKFQCFHFLGFLPGFLIILVAVVCSHVTEFPERFSDLFFCQCNLHATFLLF